VADGTNLLPSQDSARALVQGVPGAWLQVALHAAARGALIGAGAAAAGLPQKYWVRAAVGGTLAVELFVLMYELANRKPT
jgi:hypothetical protein